MKRILIFSDTHGDTDTMIRIIQEQEKVDAIIHAGDYVRDAEDIEAVFDTIPMYYVAGNSGFHSGFTPNDIFVEIFNKKFFISHGHGYNVKNEVHSEYKTLSEEGTKKGADVSVFGHTHIPYVGHYKNMFVINPGSLKYSYTYSVCEIAGDKIQIKNCIT